ncbi:MAG TPA: winged helix-turn-helix domain-containing protein [Candidatus Acidoferrales bacterium]|nr:winged helix-turn-helix domain-containing protein [Candidatus Acidoferrales bacterium]
MNRFRFSIFEFDAAKRELRRDGTVVRLQAQPAQVLACLLASAGEVVSREELRQAIWGSETFVDFDRGLNFCIGQIRSVLDDDSVTPRYVRTIPKRGYQFIAPIEGIAKEAGADSERPGTVFAKSKFPRVAALVCAGVVLATLALGAGYWLRSWEASKRRPIVAVLRFDNETSDPAMMRFSDGLTDNVVEELTAQSRGRYEVIGNARILRLPREQRDLEAISSSLHAAYVVLGQVQNDGAQTRILAHLIRMPDQTHLWVARMDRSIQDPLGTESDVAQKIAAAFADRVAKDSSGIRLPEAPSH